MLAYMYNYINKFNSSKSIQQSKCFGSQHDSDYAFGFRNTEFYSSIWEGLRCNNHILNKFLKL